MDVGVKIAGKAFGNKIENEPRERSEPVGVIWADAKIKGYRVLVSGEIPNVEVRVGGVCCNNRILVKRKIFTGGTYYLPIVHSAPC